MYEPIKKYQIRFIEILCLFTGFPNWFILAYTSTDRIMKNSNTTDRRDFIRNGTLAAAAFTILPRHVLGGKGFVAPSDKLVIAAIGVGGKGIDDINHIRMSPHAQINYLCDVDDRQAVEARKDLPKAKYYKDWRRLFDREAKNFDAVMVSTPDHNHGIITMGAMKLGKHAYTQKPLTHDVYESRMLAMGAEKYRVVTQMGNQGSSGDDTRKVEAWVQAGLIGEVHKVHCWTNRPVWPQGIPWPSRQDQIPAELDFDLWLGTAPKTNYFKELLPFNWRGWVDYGTGALGDMACHIVDVPFRALKLGYPAEVECSIGTVFSDFFQEGYYPKSFPPSSIVHFLFPARGDQPPVELSWYAGGVLPKRPAELLPDEQMGTWDGGVIFEGSKGKIMTGMWGLEPTLLPTSRMKEVNLPPPTRPLVPGGTEGHQKQWVEACLKGFGTPVSSPFSEAGPLTETVLMGVLAIRSAMYREESGNASSHPAYPGRKKLLWNGQQMQITNFDYANQLVKRTYREGWNL